MVYGTHKGLFPLGDCVRDCDLKKQVNIPTDRFHLIDHQSQSQEMVTEPI